MLDLESRAFSGALKIEKLKALLNPGPEGAVDTNKWCINVKIIHDTEKKTFTKFKAVEAG